MEKEPIPDSGEEENAVEKKTSKAENFEADLPRIRENLKNNPSFKGYAILIGILLDKGLLDIANEVADEFKNWRETGEGQ